MNEMNEILMVSFNALVGVLLGVVFFGGLWWTVQKGMTAAQPGLFFAGSLTLRTVLVVTGFMMVARGDWRRLAACLGGFVLVRISMVLSTSDRTMTKAANP